MIENNITIKCDVCRKIIHEEKTNTVFATYTSRNICLSSIVFEGEVSSDHQETNYEVCESCDNKIISHINKLKELDK